MENFDNISTADGLHYRYGVIGVLHSFLVATTTQKESNQLLEWTSQKILSKCAGYM